MAEKPEISEAAKQATENIKALAFHESHSNWNKYVDGFIQRAIDTETKRVRKDQHEKDVGIALQLQREGNDLKSKLAEARERIKTLVNTNHGQYKSLDYYLGLVRAAYDYDAETGEWIIREALAKID